jgi:predicted amidohydrolase
MATRVALIQLRCDSAEPMSDRVDRAFTLIREAAANADLVVLPELWTTCAFDLPAARAGAEPIDGALVTALRDLALELGVWIHGGSVAELASDDTRHNTCVLLDPQGTLITTYRKIHLFGFAEGERTVMTGGEQLVIVETPLGTTGLATCYDLRFPELFRALTDAGATAFLVSSGWPLSRIEHWDVLTRARAIEDQAWVIACNEVGVQGADGVVLGGHSVVIDPRGVVIAQAGETEQILYAEIDAEEPGRWREAFPALADIRIGTELA